MALKIDTSIVKTSMTEVLMQNVENFNAGTAGAIALSSHYIMGDTEDYSQLAEIASLVGRRDISVDTAAAVKAVNSVDATSVICYFSTGSIEFKKVDARRYGSDVAAFSNAIGEQIGIGFVNYMLNRGIFAVRAAIEANKATLAAGNGTTTATYSLLNTGLSKFGDASGSTATLGRPAFVTDSAGLVMKDISTGLVDTTCILGLTVGALTIAETEAREIFAETVGGKENLKTRIKQSLMFLLLLKVTLMMVQLILRMRFLVYLLTGHKQLQMLKQLQVYS